MLARLILKKFFHRFLLNLAISTMTVALLLASTLVSAAEIYGQVFLPDGKPAVNKAISVKGTPWATPIPQEVIGCACPLAHHELTIEGRDYTVLSPTRY